MSETRVLYLSYDGLTDPLGQSQVLPYLCGLRQRGYAITIISAEKPENFSQRETTIRKITADHQLQWEPVLYTKKPPVFSTIRDVRWMCRKALHLHRQQPFQIVHCRSYITALIGRWMQKKCGVRFVFDMRGFWADERVEGGLWNLRHPVYRTIYRYFKTKEREFLANADYTISLTHAAKEEIHSWTGLSQISIQVIPCCVDTKLFCNVHRPPSTEARGWKLEVGGSSWNDQRLEARPGRIGSRKSAVRNLQSAKRSSAKPEGFDYFVKLIGNLQSPITQSPNPQSPPIPFTLSYLGSLGTWYMLDEMLRFFKRLLIQRPDAQFLFITPDNPETILVQARKLEIPETHFRIQRAERKDVPGLLAQSHVSIFFIRPSFSKTASSATKMGEILSMGIPVICNAGVGDTEYLFAHYTIGHRIDAFSEANYDAAIDRMEAIMAIPATELRRAAVEYFDLQKGIDGYQEVYQHVLR